MQAIGTRESLFVFFFISGILVWKAKYLIITDFQHLSWLSQGLVSVSYFPDEFYFASRQPTGINPAVQRQLFCI